MADYNYITQSGVILPDTSAIQAQVQAEYQAAFGTDLDLSPSTPQGLLITAETLARSAVAANNAALANQINPNEAGGTFLDAILQLTGAQRIGATYSTVSVNLTGIPGTVITQGAQMQTVPNGDIFSLSASVTLDGFGNGIGIFNAINPGAISAPSGELTQIVTAILGWETGINPLDASLGTLQQSDQQARLFRRNTLALQGQSLPEAIVSGLVATSGVTGKPIFRENVTSSPITIDSITLAPHSIYVCVDGGSDLDIATTILSKKSGGCDYNGSVTVNVTEPASGQVYPVTFDRPTIVPILVRATVKNNTALTDPVVSVRQAILDYANGLLANEDGFIIGAAVSPFELAGAVNQEVPGLYVQKMEISLASIVDYVVAEIPMLIFQKASVDLGSITVITL